jgi:hypothetical protein
MKTKLLILLILVSMSSFAQFQDAKYKPLFQLQAFDPEGDECYFTITAGNSAGYFGITPCTGIVKVDTMAYETFIRQKTFNITFACTDPQKNTSKTIRKIVLKKDAQGIKTFIVTTVPTYNI